MEEEDNLILTQSDYSNLENDLDNQLIPNILQNFNQNFEQSNSKCLEIKSNNCELDQEDIRINQALQEQVISNLQKESYEFRLIEKIEEEQNEFCCPVNNCRKLFKNADCLRSHKNKYHARKVNHRKIKLPDGTYPCPICLDVLKTKFKAKKHFAFLHSNDSDWEQKGLEKEQFITEKQIKQYQKEREKQINKRQIKQKWKQNIQEIQIKNKIEDIEIKDEDIDLNTNELKLIVIWLLNAKKDNSIKSQIKNYIIEKNQDQSIKVIFPLQYLRNNHTNQKKFDIYMALLQNQKQTQISGLAQFLRLSYSATHLAITISKQQLSLEDIFMNCNLSPQKKQKISKKIFYSILNLHSLGYAHNNITPENITISEDYEVVEIKGFEYACRINENEVDGSTMQTIYNHPNQAKMKRGDIAKDFYSYGIIILQMWMDLQNFAEYAMREDFRRDLKFEVKARINIAEGKIIAQCILTNNFIEERDLDHMKTLVQMFTFERKIGMRDNMDDTN